MTFCRSSSFPGFFSAEEKAAGKRPWHRLIVNFKHPEKLGVIIRHFIRGEEFRGEFKDLSTVEAFFPNILVMVLTATVPLKGLKEILHPTFLGL